MTIDPKNYQLPDIKQGADWLFTFTMYTQQDTDPRVPIDLTGYTAKFEIRKTPNHPAIVSLTQGAGITLGGALGTVQVRLEDAVTELLESGIYGYDLFLVDGSDWSECLFEGPIRIRARYTR